jgi:hypothetical protein
LRPNEPAHRLFPGKARRIGGFGDTGNADFSAQT